MTVEQCNATVERAVNRLIGEMNAEAFGEMNEATLQHHLALYIHLDALREGEPSINMTIEKKVRRDGQQPFPKKNSLTAGIDVFFKQEDETGCAIELKCFHAANQREPNNRYDAYADLANLETYLQEHANVGYLVLITDHKHYFDPAFREHRADTRDFCLRPEHRYLAGTELIYRKDPPYGAPIILENDYLFGWRNDGHRWRVLVVQVGPERNLQG
ncbi:hypothetical protein RB2150_06063 [Rhodobacterales bacterium HTCC2150]|nr:hypothetical protein RB2150_06063 [Rhodobacterales bacterium HTCC2150] [Rhodobacteraceae bacterium HTCC2150]